MKTLEGDYMKKLLLPLIVLAIAASINAELKIKGIHTASNTVLEVFLQSKKVDVSEINLTASWKINGSAPLKIYHYAMEADLCDHFVYLETINRLR